MKGSMKFRVSVVNNGEMREKILNSQKQVDDFFSNPINFNINTEYSCTEKIYESESSETPSFGVASGI